MKPAIVIDRATGSTHEFGGLDDASICAHCTIVIVHNGWVAGIESTAGDLRQIAISGGTVFQVDRNRCEIALTAPNVYRPGEGRFDGRIHGFAAGDSRRVRALVLDGAQLKALVAADGEFALGPTRTPMVFVHNASKTGIPSVVQSGESVRVTGKDFVVGHAISVLFDGMPVAT